MSKRPKLTPLLLSLLTLTLAFASTACQDSAGITARRPKIEVTPNPLVFDTVPRGIRAERTVTITNAGDFALEPGAIEWTANPSGDFTLVDVESLPDRIEPKATATFVVAFTPSSSNAVTATLRIHSDDPDHPETDVEVRGDRRQGPVLVTCIESEDIPLSTHCPDPSALPFGDVNVGEAFTAKIHLRSEGTDPVQVSDLALAADTDGAFTIETASTAFTLPVGAQHTVTVRYAPTQQLPATGRLVATSNDPDRSTSHTALTGTGSEAWLCLEPKTLDFGSVAVGQTREATIEISNCGSGNEAVELTALEILGAAGPFTVTNPLDAPVQLPAVEGIAFSAKIRYAPTLEGETSGRFRVISNRGQATAPLAGNSAGCAIEAFPTQLSLDIEDGPRTVTFTNFGGEDCAIDGLSLDDPLGAFFLDRDPTPATLAPGGTILARVFFGAPMSDESEADLVLRYRPAGDTNAALESTTVALVGTFGHPNPGPCVLQAEPASVQFGAVPPATTRAVGLAIHGGCEDTVEFTSDSNAAFTVERGNGLYLVRFAPTAAGLATGTIHVSSSEAGVTPIDVPVTAFGGSSGLCVEPSSIDFGPTQTEATQSFTLRACGTFAVTVQQLAWARSDAEIELVSPPAFPLTLDAGDTQPITVRYAPLDNLGDTAIVDVQSDDPVRPSIEVRITGGASIVPPSAGRFLYFWQIDQAGGQSNIVRQPLQGDLTLEPFAGPAAGNATCAGCHAVSPDGRFVAVSADSWVLRFFDSETKTEFVAPVSLSEGLYVSWNPDVTTDPPYQFVYSNGSAIQKASLFTGDLGPVQGTTDGFATMPSWGPNGTIAFATAEGGRGPGAEGDVDILVVPAGGGSPTPLAGASANGLANYYPAYSPNGLWLAITQSAAGGGTISAPDARIRLVKADNSGEVIALDAANGNVGSNAYATWARDGTHLSFASTRPGGHGGWDLYLLPVDPVTGAPGTPFELTQANSSGFEHAAQWSP